MDQIYQGINFMLIGMVSVFIFLSVLVVATLLLSHILRAIETKLLAKSHADTVQIEPKVVAAITIAVKRFRNRKKH